MNASAVWAGFLLVAALAAWVGLRVWATCRAQSGLPMWDEAAHGLAGVEVAEAIRRLEPLALLQAINAQALWPFVHSLLLAPAFLIGGIGVAPAEATSVALYVATIVLLYVAGTRLHPTRGPWIGLVTASLGLLAPSYRVYGSLAFLEIPGAFLLTLAFVLFARSGEEPANPRRLAAAGWASTALFLCKYNYGVLWLAAVAWWEWEGLAPEARAQCHASLRAALAPRVWLRPVPLLLLLGLLAIVVILVSGGGAFTLFGRRVSARSPGNLPYALWLVWLLWMLVPRRGRASRAAEFWSRLPDRGRVLALTVCLPLAVWFSLPPHLRELVRFGANRDSGRPFWTLDGLLFYPRAFASDFSLVPWLGWAALALALWPPAASRRAARLAWLGLVVGLAATVLHRYRDSRFFFTVCPLLWLCASDRAAAILGALVRPLRAPVLRFGLWLASSLAVLALGGLGAANDPIWAERRAALRSPTDISPVLDAVLDHVDPSTVDAVIAAAPPAPISRTVVGAPARRLVLLGYCNSLSPGLLAWHARLHRPDVSLERLPRRVPALEADADEAALAERLRWLDTHGDVVLSVLADSGGVEYAREIAGDRRTAARLEDSDGDWRQRQNARLGRFRIARFERDR